MGRIAGRAGAGQAVVEFALTSLLLLSLVFGTVDLGRAVFMRTMLTNAVREAARQASITPNDDALIRDAANSHSPTLDLAQGALVVTCTSWLGAARNCNPNAAPTSSPEPVRPQDRITICTDYPFSLVTGWLIGRSTLTFHECEQASVQ